MSLKKYKGQDRIRGRPIRLNKQRLKVRKGRNHAELIFWGDVHYGYPTCDVKKARAMLDWALKHKAYVLGMGDYLEAGLKDSIGDSMYRQKLNPEKQMEDIIEWLRPLAERNLIIGLHEGNHEKRITKSTSINITKIMAKMLGVPYLGYACWSLLSVGKVRYSLYSEHGTSGSRFKHTKLKAAIDQCAWISSDILAMGHVHSKSVELVEKHYFDAKLTQVRTKKQYVVLTGSYLQWDDSYAQEKNYPPTGLGSPKAKLIATEKDVHFRV